MKTFILLCLVLVVGCCPTTEVVQEEVHSVPVPTISSPNVPAVTPGGDRWNAVVDSLVRLELEKRPYLYRDSLIYVERQAAGEKPSPRVYSGRHITPSGDTTDIAFHLERNPYFAYESKRGPLRFAEIDTTQQYRPTIQEFPFLKKVGLVAIALLIQDILLIALYLFLKAKGKLTVL